jgi:hypothetical protein
MLSDGLPPQDLFEAIGLGGTPLPAIGSQSQVTLAKLKQLKAWFSIWFGNEG